MGGSGDAARPRAAFDGIDLPDVDHVEVRQRDAHTDPKTRVAEDYRITDVNVFCRKEGDARVLAEWQEGTLLIDAPDHTGNWRREEWFVVYRSVVRRSFGPGKPRMWMYTFRGASRPATT